MLTNLKKTKQLFDKITDTSEFEVMFNNYTPKNKLSIVKFTKLLGFIKYRANEKNMKLSYETTLDVNYGQSSTNVYRITIKGIDNINKVLNMVHQRRNNIIYSMLISQFYTSDNFEFMNKKKDHSNVLDFDEYDIRIRLSDELPVEKNVVSELSDLLQSESDKIFFRYKQRISLIEETNDYKLSTDLTIIKSSNNPNKLYEADKTFEIELEFKPYKKLNDKMFDKILNEIQIIKQVLENTEYILTKEENIDIINNYKKIIYNSEKDESTILYSMQPISAEVQHVVDKIPNKYSVTDKADGDKFQLFIFNKEIYLISNNLEVRKTKYKSSLDNTILEGELLYIDNVYVFMIYDCLVYNGKDIRKETTFTTRYLYVLEFTKDINPAVYIINNFIGSFDIIKQENHYQKELENFYKNLNKMISNAKPNDIIFHHKIMLFPTGAENCEVYSFSYLLWTLCTSNSTCPYMLDGIIYTGLEQKYTKDKRDQAYPIYKYKPPHTNSIDIYITFQRNIDIRGYLEFYDNSLSAFGKNKVFRIANFFVGEMIGSKEIPVPFMKEENNHEAYFMLDNDEVRDIEGRLVNDNTVVEVIYTNNSDIPHQYRWKILRTRWDKTESVLRDKKRYGNYKDVAIRVWKSMREAVTIDEIRNLSKVNTYVQQKKLLTNKIDKTIISSERAQDIYYQKITELGKIFRLFSNWVKSIIIYPYCGPVNKHKKDVLDIGCGRGGDIMKWYHGRVKEYIGIDPDHEGLFGAIDSAIVRYQGNCTKYPDFPPMTFIQADASIPLQSEIQSKKLFNMTSENKHQIDKIFNSKRKFDVISFQYSIHYLFDQKESLDNMINVIKKYLKKDGYIICTTFDAKQVMTLLSGKDSYTSWYTDDDGQKKKFFQITKKFSGPLKDTYGQNVDVHMGWVHLEDNYATEYFVTTTALINVMKEASCTLIETDLFANVYTINKEWFIDVIEHEENLKNKKFYKNVAQFYGDLKNADRESKIWNDLFRYYVFKKI
jgi:SAM-dependent methyltransferase